MKHAQVKTDLIEESHLLEQLENRLLRIETEELLEQMTVTDLTQRGFIGQSEPQIEQARFRDITEKEKLVFEPGVEYFRAPEHENIDAIGIDLLLFVRDVVRGELIAHREINETVPFHAGRNVFRTESGGAEQYRAAVNGKVVIIGDTMHVVGSDVDCTVSVRISHDKMSAFLSCTSGHGEGRRLTDQVVIEEMRNAGVLFGIKEDVVREAVSRANIFRESQHDILAAQGTPSIKGEDAEIELGFANESDTTSPRILPDGRIDYKGSASIPCASEGQLLVRIGPAGRGICGVNVLGESIPALPGEEGRIVAGQGIRASEDGTQFFAGRNGCVLYNPPFIEVAEIYDIPGDVDYTTGSIDFNGTVIIRGNVREGFEVKASADVIVHGCIEATRVSAGRDVRVMGGIQGKEKGVVSAGRDIHAEYAQNACIESRGTVCINDFAVNSRIYCTRLESTEGHGSIVGGEVWAQRGIDVITLGSAGGAKTMVYGGVDFLVQRKLTEMDNAVDFCTTAIRKIDSALKPVLARMKNGRAIGGNTDLVDRTLKKRHSLVEQVSMIQEKRAALAQGLVESAACFVKVKGVCHGDVFISIKGIKLRVTGERQNATFFDDPREGVIRVGPY